MNMSESNKGRIAIKFGTAPSTNKSSRPKPPSTLGKRSRTAAWDRAGSDSDSGDDGKGGRHETITAFGAEGAENERKKKEVKKDYVIPRQGNRDWRGDIKTQKRGKNMLPEEARAKQNGHNGATEPANPDEEIKWGLSITQKTAAEEEDPTTKPEEEPSEVIPETNGEEPPTKTADDAAMNALLGIEPTKAPTIIHPTEEDAYKRDVSAAGQASTLEDYEAMPVEEFGAALLRGMGWNGKDLGPKVKEVKRRPNRLGLGAKELKGVEELGGWNQKGGSKPKRAPRLDEFRREESRKKEARGRERDDRDKRERERERDGGHRRERDYDDRDRRR